MKRLLSIFLVIVMCIANVSPAFAISEGKYKNIWNDLSGSEQKEWAGFLSGIPKIRNANLSDSISQVANSEDITELFNFYNEFTNGMQSEFSGPIFEKHKRRLVYRNDYKDEDTYRKWLDEWSAIVNSLYNLSYDDAERLTWFYPYNIYNAKRVKEMLKKHYGLSVDSSTNIITNSGLPILYSKKYDSYILSIPEICGRYRGYEFVPNNIYRVLDNLYYIEGVEQNWIEEAGYEHPYVYESKKTHILIRRNDLQDDWRLYESGDGWLSDEQLNTKVRQILPHADITIDYSNVKNYTNLSDYIVNLEEALKAMNGALPSDAAIAEISRYSEFAFENVSEGNIEADGKELYISKADLEPLVKKILKNKNKLNDFLQKHEIQTNKELEANIKLKVSGANVKKGIRIGFEDGLADVMEGVFGLKIVLDEKGHSIYLKKDELKNIIESSAFKYVELSGANGEYTIVFLDKVKKDLDRLPAHIMFSLPAESELYSIMVAYKGGQDNWGGQFDANEKTLSFATKFSGNYSVVEGKLNISDIGELDEEKQQAIRFMVSKGYMSLQDTAFNPNAVLSRNDFTTALVRMFFALDREKKTMFSDVPADSFYYPYIASAESDGIAKGYEDGTFRGELAAQKENVVAFCARTLADKKGYSYPDDIESYLSFDDRANIADWAKKDIALAVRSGLIENTGNFNPKSELTRAESAEILYKLFMLLYDTSPVSMTSKENSAKIKVMLAGFVLVILAVVGIVIYTRKRRASELNEEVSTVDITAEETENTNYENFENRDESMLCPNCGVSYKEGAKFCGSCGNKI